MAQPDSAEEQQNLLLQRTAEAHCHLQRWRLLVATAHRPFATLLRLQLAAPQVLPPFREQRLVAVCETAADLLEQLPSDASDVLVLMDETLRDGSTLPLLQVLLQRTSPPTIMLAMAAPLQAALVRAAWRTGVHALLCSDEFGNGELLRAMQALTQNERYCGPAFADLMAAPGPAFDALSRRELEVLPLLAEGCSNRQIAERLQIADVTARDHVQHILQKLQVSDRAAAAALAVRLGLVR